jgi:hypothetical protein
LYGILGEHASDVDTLDILIRRLQEKHRQSVTQNLKKGYTGSGTLKNEGWKALREFNRRGCARFLVAQDADQKDVGEIRAEIIRKIIKPAGITGCVCIIIPVQEIEAWLLADILAVSKIFTGWKPKEVASPESIAKPKEYLEKLSRQVNEKPRYIHAKHNAQLARYVDLDLVTKRCQSFKPLENLVVNGRGNL